MFSDIFFVRFRGDVPRGWSLAEGLVFRKVRKALGLDRCDVRIVTGAPVRKETLEFFMSLNIPLSEIYGTSECSGNCGFNVHLRQV